MGYLHSPSIWARNVQTWCQICWHTDARASTGTPGNKWDFPGGWSTTDPYLWDFFKNIQNKTNNQMEKKKKFLFCFVFLRQTTGMVALQGETGDRNKIRMHQSRAFFIPLGSVWVGDGKGAWVSRSDALLVSFHLTEEKAYNTNRVHLWWATNTVVKNWLLKTARK